MQIPIPTNAFGGKGSGPLYGGEAWETGDIGVLDVVS